MDIVFLPESYQMENSSAELFLPDYDIPVVFPRKRIPEERKILPRPRTGAPGAAGVV